MDFDFDVLVAGAGPSGCLAARDLGLQGFRVGLLDRSPRQTLGTPVVVEVEQDIFQRVGLRPPAEREIPYHARTARVFSSRNVEAYAVDAMPTVALRLDGFSRRLLREAEQASVSFLGAHTVDRLLWDGGRVCGAVVRHEDQPREIRARLVLDATGFQAALVRALDPALGFGFEASAGDVVRAANALHRIDPEAARRAVRAGLHADEELRIRLGTLGAYSTEFSFLSIRNNRAYILIGHKDAYDAPPMAELMRAFTRSQGYYRKRLHGGESRIRIANILDRLVCDGFMVLGEAACMVIPINGSGVSSGLLAAHLAARTAGEALRCGNGTPGTASLWPYAARYQRSRGAILASYSAIRLMTESLGEHRVDAMLESGLSRAEDLINANVPRLFALSPASVAGRLKALIRHPGMIPPVVRGVTAMQALHRHYLRYPERFDPASFQRWRERRIRIYSRIPR